MKEIKLEINGKDYTVQVDNFGAYEATVKVNERTYNVKLKDLGLEAAEPVAFAPAPAAAPTVQATPQSTTTPAPAAAAGGVKINAPMPGLILTMKVKVGDTVKAGDILMVMEAMKMENNVEATSSGTIQSISVKEGDNVSEGDTLITIG